MMARDSFRSTATALAFMATSMLPIEPPKMNRAMAASRHVRGERYDQQTDGAGARQTSRRTVREPCLRDQMAGPGIAAVPPSQSRRISRPSVNSVISSRVSTSGICGAQLPVRKPLARNMAATAHRPCVAVMMALLASKGNPARDGRRGT